MDYFQFKCLLDSTKIEHSDSYLLPGDGFEESRVVSVVCDSAIFHFEKGKLIFVDFDIFKDEDDPCPST